MSPDHFVGYNYQPTRTVHWTEEINAALLAVEKLRCEYGTPLSWHDAERIARRRFANDRGAAVRLLRRLLPPRIVPMTLKNRGKDSVHHRERADREVVKRAACPHCARPSQAQ